jgi:hypothetical protein
MKWSPGSQLRAVIYYRNRWVAVTAPAPFPLSDDAVLNWLVAFDEDEQLLPQQQEDSSLANSGELDEDKLLLPEIAFLPRWLYRAPGYYRVELHKF